MKQHATYIPAQPGYHTVELIGQSDGDGKVTSYAPFLRPILAWAIVADETPDDLFVHPVTVEGVDTWSPVVYPDGRVERAHEYDHKSVAEWMKWELQGRADATEDGAKSTPESSAPVPDSLG